MVKPQPLRFVLKHRRSPGDIVCLTALVRDIKKAYPEIILDLDTTCGELWQNNPHLSQTPLWNKNTKNPKITVPGTRFIHCDYQKGLKGQNHEAVHFVSYFHRDFTTKTGLKVPLTLPHGDLHLTQHENSVSPLAGRYWVLINGGKSDFTIKVWHTNDFQEVVNQLLDKGIQCVQLGDNQTGHWQPKLENTLDLRGRVGLRGMLQFIRHSDGVLCGVTAAMHMAAALGRPCVCIAGGREAWWWEAYVRNNKGLGDKAIANKLPMPHRYLHTIGLLDCCKTHGCWRNKVVKISEDPSLCKYPVFTPEMPVAKCMHLITPKHVVEAVMSYYEDKSLPAIAEVNPCEISHVVSTRPASKVTLQVRDQSALRSPEAGIAKMAQERPDLTITANTATAENTMLDHKFVGGKFTVFVLLYGEAKFFDMHRRCLESILRTIPTARLDLRVGSNNLNHQSVAMVESLISTGQVSKHYRHEGNDYKYPVMREMFFDPTHPIRTKWVMWFDDDSICDKDPKWLIQLATQIIAGHTPNNHMLGARLAWSLNTRQQEIFAASKWFTGKVWQNRAGVPTPGGTTITFAHGGFWAITHEAIVKADIPDLSTGLTHTGGDWQIGCQIYQSGFGIRQFNGSKQYVHTSSVPRRGVTMPRVDQVQTPVKAAITPVEQAPSAPVVVINNQIRSSGIIRL